MRMRHEDVHFEKKKCLMNSGRKKSAPSQRDPPAKIVLAKFLHQNDSKRLYVVSLHCWRWNAKMERDKCKQCTEDAKKELEEADKQSAPPYAPRSNDLRKSHYTFDFAQQVLLPHTARQVGPIHFKTPRKIQLFGVCTEGIPKASHLSDSRSTNYWSKRHTQP